MIYVIWQVGVYMKLWSLIRFGIWFITEGKDTALFVVK